MQSNVSLLQSGKQNSITPSTDLSANSASLGGTLTVSGASSVAMASAYVNVSKSAVDGGATTGVSNATPLSISISSVNGSVQAAQFIAVSDARIKSDIQLESTETLAAGLYGLPVTSWRYVDDISKGTRRRLGFVAQAVKSIDALGTLATATHADFIPSVYRRAAVAPDGRLTLDVPHGLEAGDRIRYFSTTEKHEARVSRIISETDVYIDADLLDLDEIFVYGRYTSDVLSIDYDAIVTALVATVQSQNMRLRALEERRRAT